MLVDVNLRAKYQLLCVFVCGLIKLVLVLRFVSGGIELGLTRVLCSNCGYLLMLLEVLT